MPSPAETRNIQEDVHRIGERRASSHRRRRASSHRGRRASSHWGEYIGIKPIDDIQQEEVEHQQQTEHKYILFNTSNHALGYTDFGRTL